MRKMPLTICALMILSACSTQASDSQLKEMAERQSTLEGRVAALEDAPQEDTIALQSFPADLESLQEDMKLLQDDVLTLKVNLLATQLENSFWEFLPDGCSSALANWEGTSKSHFARLRKQCKGDVECLEYHDKTVANLQEHVDHFCR